MFIHTFISLETKKQREKKNDFLIAHIFLRADLFAIHISYSFLQINLYILVIKRNIQSATNANVPQVFNS